jgi:hypothetical protein
MDNKVVAKNLGGVVVSGKFLDRLCKMVIMDNQYLDKESAEILCRHIDDLRLTIGVQDDTTEALKKTIESQKNTIAILKQDQIIRSII